MSVAEKALTYATIILADGEVTIDAEKLKAVTTAAGFTDIQPIYYSLFTKAFEQKNVLDLITDLSAGAPAPAAVGGAAAAGGAEAAAEEKKEEAEEEESDDDMGFGLFD
ncbi:hypothetical protein H4219_004639 [Mycoemilia scoparia]|uniref:60S acidic ribosomal protein P1 n=1 Tax=Mycoemilia scoparia TaxID=417184 RepID=A0A9W7ZVM8_9FUNG|nr:hypothetical protein H4219_004639 [Mycoemilia scoparia]